MIITNLLMAVMLMTLVTVMIVPASVLKEHEGLVMGWLLALTITAVILGWS